MTAQPTGGSTGSVVVPPETQEKFGPLVALILGSESMNLEERQYWVNILPVMTPEQLKSLEDILVSEKQQLQAIDAKYAGQTSAIDSTASLIQTEERIKSRKIERERKEKEALLSQAQDQENILSQIESF